MSSLSRYLWTLVLATVGLGAAPAWSMGIARTANATVLGQPLDFAATIRLEGDESLRPECVSAEVSLGDRVLSSGSVRVQVDGVGSERRVRVRTSVVVDEPIVTVTLKLGCPVQFSRSFVAFVDPPAVSLAQTAPSIAPASPSPPIAATAAPTASAPAATEAAAGASGGGSAVPSPAAAASPPTPTATPTTGSQPTFAGSGTASPATPAAPTRPPPARRAERPATPGPSVVQVPAERPAARTPQDTGERREAAAQARVAQARAEPQSRLQLDPVLPGRAASAPRPSASAPVAGRIGGAGAGAPAEASGSGVAAAPTPPATPASLPRTTPASAPVAPGSAPASAPASAQAAASDPTGLGLAAGRSAAEDEALRQLEVMLTAMRNEALSTQRSVAILQARLHQAERERWANPVVYGLAGAVALLALGLAFVMWKLRQIQSERAWWQQTTQDGAASRLGVGASPEAGATTVQDLDGMDTRYMNGETSTQPAAATGIGSLTTSSMGLSPLGAIAAAAAAGLATKAAATTGAADRANAEAEARREVTVEELIDLEQQADFFIVLGQDDAAIDVLMGHLRSSGGATPLPYLKLLEIYHRRDDREAYERIRERFNRRFNAYAPEWGKDLQLGRSLDEYPAAVTRLQAVWPNPEAAMQYLQDSLLRAEDEVGTFDLPAYREVLLLYAVARDNAERAETSSVDLLLPFAEAKSASRADGQVMLPPDAGPLTGPDGAGADTRQRYDTDFQFDASGFLSQNSTPPPKRN